MSNILLPPASFLRYLNPDGGLPYAPGNPSCSEPTLLMILAFLAAGEGKQAEPLVNWALHNRNADGSIGLNREFHHEGIWNTPLFAIAMHHLGRQAERDSAIAFILSFRSIQVNPTPDNDVDTSIVGWPWVGQTFGWVEPTSWALLSLMLVGKGDHPRAVEGRRLLENRCIREGGWNYGNKVVFNHTLMPFWDTTALALLALGDSNPELRDRNLELLEKSLPEMRSLLCTAMTCICFDRFRKNSEEIRNRLAEMLASTSSAEMNFAHAALALIALSRKRVLTS
jgi:hypothetical protein